MPRALRTGACLFFGLLLLTAAAFARRGEMREWTSADGRTMRAALVEVDRGSETARFRRDDGRFFTIGWDRLSPDDRAQLQARPDARTEPDSPDTDTTPDDGASEPLPREFELDDVPMVRQRGNFCVPASAAMIAGFHGIDTDQEEIAKLSSEDSFSNRGTYPGDMLLAMEKLGFDGEILNWSGSREFTETVLPQLRRALHGRGPVYISFKPGVFGNSGHGCIIIGYDDRNRELTFHNPWGNIFERDYAEVAKQGRGLVFIDPPAAAPVATEAYMERIREAVPEFDGDLAAVVRALKAAGIPHEWVWCSRRDARGDKRFAEQTARRDGRKILELAFERNPAVLIPRSPEGRPQRLLCVTRPPEGARFNVRRIDANGWSDPKLTVLGRLTRHWATRFERPEGATLWELPMIELRSN